MQTAGTHQNQIKENTPSYIQKSFLQYTCGQDRRYCRNMYKREGQRGAGGGWGRKGGWGCGRNFARTHGISRSEGFARIAVLAMSLWVYTLHRYMLTSTYPSICILPSIYLHAPIHLSAYTYPSIWILPSIYLHAPIHLSAYTHPFICIHSSIYLHTPIHLSAYTPPSICIHSSIYLHTPIGSSRAPIHVPIGRSIYN